MCSKAPLGVVEKRMRSVCRTCARGRAFAGESSLARSKQRRDGRSISFPNGELQGKGRCHVSVNCFTHLETFRFYIESEL